MILCPRPRRQLAMCGEQFGCHCWRVGETSLASSGKRAGILLSLKDCYHKSMSPFLLPHVSFVHKLKLQLLEASGLNNMPRSKKVPLHQFWCERSQRSTLIGFIQKQDGSGLFLTVGSQRRERRGLKMYLKKIWLKTWQIWRRKHITQGTKPVSYTHLTLPTTSRV